MTIKSVPVELLERLRERAAASRRSMNAEVIALLEEATMEKDEWMDTDLAALREQTMQLRERLRARYGELSDSTALIRDARDER